jgi:hypothetical protein
MIIGPGLLLLLVASLLAAVPIRQILETLLYDLFGVVSLEDPHVLLELLVLLEGVVHLSFAFFVTTSVDRFETFPEYELVTLINNSLIANSPLLYQIVQKTISDLPITVSLRALHTFSLQPLPLYIHSSQRSRLLKLPSQRVHFISLISLQLLYQVYIIIARVLDPVHEPSGKNPEW